MVLYFKSAVPHHVCNCHVDSTVLDIVTSVQGQSFYCRSINMTDTGGLCIIVTPKVVFAASYKNSFAPNSVAPQAIPYIIDQVQHFDKM